jgi:hypothetical protein
VSLVASAWCIGATLGTRYGLVVVLTHIELVMSDQQQR